MTEEIIKKNEANCSPCSGDLMFICVNIIKKIKGM